MRRKRALLLEDNTAIRFALKQLLDKLGFEVLDFPDPGSCPLQRADKCSCPRDRFCADVIISDIDMPQVSGIDFVANQVRKGCKVKNIALMSGGWSTNELHQADALGCKTLSKPFDFAELKRWLHNCEQGTVQSGELCDWSDNHLPTAGKNCF